MREPSLEAKYFCSSTNSTCELTKLTPATASAVSFSFIRNAILVSSGTSNGSRLKALVQVADDLVGVGEHDLARRQHGVGAGDRDRLFGGGARRPGFDAVGRGEAPRAVHQHAQAEAVAGRARDVLHLPLARRDRFAAIAVDADVGVRRAERGRARQRRVGRLGARRVVGRAGLEGLGPGRHGDRGEQGAAGGEELSSGEGSSRPDCNFACRDQISSAVTFSRRLRERQCRIWPSPLPERSPRCRTPHAWC